MPTLVMNEAAEELVKSEVARLMQDKQKYEALLNKGQNTWVLLLGREEVNRALLPMGVQLAATKRLEAIDQIKKLGFDPMTGQPV